MEKYHKIQTVFMRDPETRFKKLLMGQYSIPEFEYLKDNAWIFTEKVDGTNVRVLLGIDTVDFKGKDDNSMLHPGLLKALQKMFPFDLLDSVFTDREDEEGGWSDVCLYGEGYGAKIQKGGGNYCKDQSFVLFDVRVGNWWLRRDDVLDVARKLDILCVPEIGRGTLADMIDKVCGGIQSRWGDFPAEGIVARPEVELFARNGDRIITKLKHKDF
jgi:hypothetical protein